MKPAIHPTYYNNAKVHCACGQTWITGSTLPDIEIEICSNCHPFYSGKEKVLDTRGRVDKFKKRLEKSQRKTLKK
ncbi:MAG: 50S ribosomal protein L31 [Candidatus Yanofskybacteria bacterium]|nr:50S ribosomal protein L31 [Candidatus Yanofskybacteria bacterium]